MATNIMIAYFSRFLYSAMVLRFLIVNVRECTVYLYVILKVLVSVPLKSRHSALMSLSGPPKHVLCDSGNSDVSPAAPPVQVF